MHLMEQFGSINGEILDILEIYSPTSIIEEEDITKFLG